MNYVFDNGPHLKTKNTCNKILYNLMIALLPIIVFAIYQKGISAVVFLLTGVIVSFVSELLYCIFVSKKKGSELKNYLKQAYVIFPGLFLALVLPVTTPILHLILGCVFATIVGKMIFGGFGHNIFNPALLGYLFIMICFGVGVDTISGSTPLTNLSIVGYVGSEAQIVVPSLLDMFLGIHKGGALGEVSSVLIVIGFLYLAFTKTIKTRIPLMYVGTVFTMTFVIALLNNMGIWYPVYHVLSGGLLFGAVFMATDPVTTPITKTGQVLFGLFLGILTVCIRFLFPYPEGVMISILTMNIFVVILDKLGVMAALDVKKHWLFVLLVSFLAIAGSVFIGLSFHQEEETVDPKFHIDQVEENNGFTIYQVTAKLKSNAKIRIEIDQHGTVATITILEHHETESYYKEVIENQQYLNKLISHQKNLEKLDTVSGATLTSKGLKDMLTKVLKDYQSK